MNFQLLGVNHKTAPVEVREQLAIPESKLPEALRELMVPAGCEGHDSEHLQPRGDPGANC